MRRISYVAAACSLLFAAHAHSATYVLHAPSWGARQDAAVAAAGGAVSFSHAAAGVAVVQSSVPGFMDSLGRSGAITGGALDQTVRWTVPSATVTQSAINTANDFFYPLQWAPGSIEAPAAWAAGYTGRGVRVAVIDGGVWRHPELVPNLDIAASRSFVPEEEGANNACRIAFDCDEDEFNFWHGTHVAGIIGARDDGQGVVGIAPEATLIAVKALHLGSGSFASVISAILYAAGPARADIINMSLGATFAKSEPGASQLRSALSKAVKEASKTALVVVASGNDYLQLDGNNYTTVPAESGPTMVVSATGPMGWAKGATDFSRPASYTNFGHSLVSVGAPGGDFALPGEELCAVPTGIGNVVNRCWVFDMVFSTNVGGWSWSAGTSMAAPAVAAVAALAKQKYPGMTPDQLRKHIEKSTTEVGPNNTATHGRGYLNARRAVMN